MLDLLSGVTSHDIQPDRLRMHYLSYPPEDGIPVLLIHGNLATGRFFEHLMPNAPDGYRFLTPDMRRFGDTECVRIDATRSLRDWAGSGGSTGNPEFAERLANNDRSAESSSAS